MKNTKVNDITVIIPVHEITEATEQLLRNAVKSVKAQSVLPKLTIVTTEALAEQIEALAAKEFGKGATVLVNTGKTDFASQINLAVEKSTTEWFCILEMDDELASFWMKNVVQYREVYGDVDIFLPIIVDVNKDNAFAGFTNEAVWAAEFSQELGIVDNEALLGYTNFSFDGMVMRRETYLQNGGIKASMKLTFPYEFFLRMTYMSVRVMVIPKYGYKHMNHRDGSLFKGYVDSLPADETRWWMSLAKKEYFHTKDRGITYDKAPI